MENDNFRIIVSEKNGDDSQRDQDEVVEEMISRTIQPDGRCFETFRRINVTAVK